MKRKVQEKHIPTTVTFLDMATRPEIPAPSQPHGKIAILRAERPAVHFYRYLYDTIGRDYYWVDRKKMGDETLAAYLAEDAVHLYVLYVDGCPAGIAELDFRSAEAAQLAYFGLIPEYVGRHLGHYFLYQAVRNAWAQPIRMLKVNTCTLDHPRALPLYQRVGFSPYSREERYIILP